MVDHCWLKLRDFVPASTRGYRRLFLAMADTCAHAAFFSPNLSSTLARLLHSHEILSSIRLSLYEIATSAAFASVCEWIGYHRTLSLINTCIDAWSSSGEKTAVFWLLPTYSRVSRSNSIALQHRVAAQCRPLSNRNGASRPLI